MNILDVLSNTTLAAISTDVQAAMAVNAQQYAQTQIPLATAKVQKQTEDDFLYGRNGEFLDLQRRPESKIETIGSWHYNGNVGNDPDKIGPGHPTAAYSWTPGDTGILTATGSVGVNVYLYMPLPMPATLPRRVVDCRTHRILNTATWRAPEFQFQFVKDGQLHNAALQWHLLTKKLKYFIYGDTWHEFPFQPPFPDFTKPVQTYAEFAMDAKTTTHVSVTINGATYPLGVTNPTFPKVQADKFTVGVQIDPQVGSCALQISQHDVRFK